MSLSVCVCVCPSVTCVLSDKTKKCTADILIGKKVMVTQKGNHSSLLHQQWLVGDAPFRLKCELKMTDILSKNAHFDRFPLIKSQR